MWEIVRVGGPRRSSQVHVRFLEGEDAGLQDWVAPASLVALWDDVAVFQADDAAELALAEASRQVRKTAEFETAEWFWASSVPRASCGYARVWPMPEYWSSPLSTPPPTSSGSMPPNYVLTQWSARADRAQPSWQSWHRHDDRKLQAEDDVEGHRSLELGL